MNSGDSYKFLPLRDAIVCLEQKVNLLGVIIEIGLPKKSRGTDYVCTLKIVDESFQSPPISVNIFSLRIEELPQVKAVGDLIQLSHVVMKSYDGDTYVLFNKKFSSFALFDGKSNKIFSPYQVSPKFQLKDCNEDIITRLRTWLVTFQLNASGTRECLVSLKDIKEEEYFDLICKILLVYEVSKDDRMLFVWDGTDCPPTCIQNKLGDEAENPLLLQLESSPLSRDVLCTFPSVGSILRVAIDQAYHISGLSSLCGGEWVRLRKITCKVLSGLWRGALNSGSGIRLLSNEDNVVLQRLRAYEERISSESGHLPSSVFPSPSSITGTDYDHAPCVTLMGLLTHPKVTANFKCVVRVVAIYPSHAEHFCSPNGKYRLRLTLEDTTARIHAYLYAEDGEKFFKGHHFVEELRMKRNKLVGVTEKESGEEDDNIPRDPPWVQCCLKAYYLRKDDCWGSRHYRIYGTFLVD